MESKMFVTAKEVAEDLEISMPFAYKIIRKMNDELKAQGYMVISGRTSRIYYEEKFYKASESE